uniref:Uncharacterized protein n=1 Tax=Arundo donax TaxID=35708 RepID=A0A0A9G5P8_ARUDO
MLTFTYKPPFFPSCSPFASAAVATARNAFFRYALTGGHPTTCTLVSDTANISAQLPAREVKA